MRLLYLNFLIGFVVLVSYKVVSGIVAKRRRDAELTRRGCAPAPVLKLGKDPLGISTMRQALRATKEERQPQFIIACMDSVGKNIHTVQTKVMGADLTLTRDPENVKAMFANQSADWDIGAARARAFMPYLGIGIFTSRGEAWRHSRALVRPQFAHNEISDIDLEERHVQAMLDVLPVGQDGWTKEVNLQPLFYNFTLDTSTEFLYGHSVHSQNPNARATSILPVLKDRDGPDQANFGHHLDEAKAWIHKRSALSKFYWLISSKEFDHHCSEVHKYVDWFVEVVLRHQKTQSQGGLDTSEKKSEKKKFILLDALAEYTQNPMELRYESLNILTAGRDTTGALLGWIFYFLARNPQVYQTFRRIILAEFGPDPTGKTITFAKLKSCQYIRYVINESLRVAAVIPMNERVAQEDTTLPRGGGPDGSKPIFIPKGNQVMVPLYAMQHRPDIWGYDVEEFKPERWEGRKVGWEFVPFGSGPRMCLGRELSPPLSVLVFEADFFQSSTKIGTLITKFLTYRAILHHGNLIPPRTFPPAFRRHRKHGPPTHQIPYCHRE